MNHSYLSPSSSPSPCPPLPFFDRMSVRMIQLLDYYILSHIDTRITPSNDIIISSITRPQRVVMFYPQDTSISTGTSTLTSTSLSASQDFNKRIYLHFHGGGFIGGSCMSDAVYCQYIANQANVMVISCNYSLAPEYPYPYGLQDCFEILQWLNDTYHPHYIAIGGHSAGGTLAYGVMQLASMHNIPIHSVISFFCPFNFSSTSKHTFQEKNPYTRNIFHQSYLKHVHDCDLSNPLLSPSYISYMTCKTSLLIVAKNDPNVHDMMEFIDKMKLQIYPEEDENQLQQQQQQQHQHQQQSQQQQQQHQQQSQHSQQHQQQQQQHQHYYHLYSKEFHGWCNLPDWILYWFAPKLYRSKWDAYALAASMIKQSFQL